MSPTHTTITSAPSSVSADMSSTSSAITSVNTINSISPETHSCPYNGCNKSFSKKYNLKAHLRLHTGEQPFECDRPDCRKKFKWRSSLSSHTVWHTRKDNASAISAPANIASTKLPSSKPGSAQKTPTSSTISVAPHPSSQRVNTNSSSVSASASHPNFRRKRPRSEMSGSSLDSRNCAELEHSRMRTSSRTRPKLVRSTGSAAKKRRARDSAPAKTGSEQKLDVQKLEKNEVELIAPGSPVTSDGCDSEKALDLEEFPCDILQPLLARGDGLDLATDTEVGAIMGGEDGQLFGYEDSTSCVPLSGLDSRFEQFDFDNFTNLYLNKLEGL